MWELGRPVGLIGLLSPAAVCWSVITGDLSPSHKGVYWTRPEAFGTGPPSCAVNSMTISVLPDRSQNLWGFDAIVLQSARCSPSRSGVTATSPCTILHTRARRWDFWRCSKLCRLRSLVSWEMLTCSRWLLPHTQCTALFCIFCSIPWSLFQCGSCVLCTRSHKAEMGNLF